MFLVLIFNVLWQLKIVVQAGVHGPFLIWKYYRIIVFMYLLKFSFYISSGVHVLGIGKYEFLNNNLHNYNSQKLVGWLESLNFLSGCNSILGLEP